MTLVPDPVAAAESPRALAELNTWLARLPAKLRVAWALEALSGVDVGKLLPIPDISNKRIPEAMKHEARGLHQVMYRMSPDDYRGISSLWKGPHPEDGSELRVVDGPPEGGPVPEHHEEPQLTSPIGPDGVDRGMLSEIATRLFGKNM